MVNIKILNSEHKDYDSMQMFKLKLLYDGGYEILKHSELFIKKLQIESQNAYKERLSIVSFIPYVSKFVNTFSSSLFSAEIYAAEAADANDTTTLGESVSEEDDFYKLFSSDCNLQNTSLHNFMKDKFTESLYLPYALIGVDFAVPTDIPTNLLEEEQYGLSRPHLYSIDPLSLINWKKNAQNDKFEWVVLKRECVVQDTPLDEPLKYLEFKLWTMIDNVANWQLYKTKPIRLDREHDCAANKDVPLAGSGSTTFKEIPIFELKIPSGFHIGEKVGPINEEHFNRRSFLVSNLNKTCISIPVIKLGPEMSAPGDSLPSEVQQNPNRALGMRNKLSMEGYTIIGKDDDVKIVEATGTSHLTTRDDIKDLESRMPEIINQMAASAAYMLKFSQHSAASKKEDRHQSEILLTAYSQLVRDIVKEVYIAISTARNESVVWSIQGLSTFVEDNRQELLQELISIAGKDVPILSMFPSPTLHKKYLLKTGLSMLGTYSPEEERTIQEELEAGIEAGKHLEMQNKIALASAEPPENNMYKNGE